MTSLLLRNVHSLGGEAADVLVVEGRIAAIGASLDAPEGAVVEDGIGALLLPGLVEGQTHLDKTLWGLGQYRNDVAPALTDKIDNERAWRSATNHDAGAASLAMAKRLLAPGTTAIRSFVDVDTDVGLRHLHGLLDTRAAMTPRQRIQVVAFSKFTICRPGTDALLDGAMAAGADMVADLDPCGIDRDPVRHLDIVFGLAQKHGKPVDIHLHEPGEMGAFSRDLSFKRTAALGMRGAVVVSHGFCLGMIGAGARGCGFAGHGLAVGDRADLELVRAEAVAEAIVARPVRALVVSAGQVGGRARGGSARLIPGRPSRPGQATLLRLSATRAERQRRAGSRCSSPPPGAPPPSPARASRCRRGAPRPQALPAVPRSA
jgi:cytosine/adenosine deaminase-related metal-dependent hydrolase